MVNLSTVLMSVNLRGDRQRHNLRLISSTVIAILAILSSGKATPAGAPTREGMRAITDFVFDMTDSYRTKPA